MPPMSQQRCAVCGRTVERNGHAKVYVHANQFHQRLNHQAVVAQAPIRLLEPVARQRTVIDLRDAEPVSA